MKQKFSITGMECPHCAARVQKVLTSLKGVQSAVVSNETQDAVVEYDEAVVTKEALIEAIDATGFRVVL
ncbi:MAG: cation transporter [Oscillospiraceae bacterium]|nr:cation transporter [Oscillospiraceae bacterium]